ncbi:MAG: GFA family protein [Burkholderiaceae bacterium]
MNGSCLCASIRYEVRSLAGPIVHCHCRTCRKAHAAAFTSTARVNREDFRWSSGLDLLGSFESTPGKLRHFCRRCGSHLVAEWTDQPQVILRVATLDDDPGARPAAHIWRSHSVEWLENGVEIPSYQEVPPPKA